MMKTKNILASLAVLSVVLFTGCQEDKIKTVNYNEETSGITLGQAGKLAVLASSVFSNTRETVIAANQGLRPGTSIGGFPPGVMNGTIRINDKMTNPTKLYLTTTFNGTDGNTSNDLVSLAGIIGGITLIPDLYKSTSSLEISFGKANSVFIIHISTFTTISGRNIKLNERTETSNIFWQISCSVSYGTTSVINGTVMIRESISFDKEPTFDNRALAKTGSVGMENNTIMIK